MQVKSHDLAIWYDLTCVPFPPASGPVPNEPLHLMGRLLVSLSQGSEGFVLVSRDAEPRGTSGAAEREAPRAPLRRSFLAAPRRG